MSKNKDHEIATKVMEKIHSCKCGGAFSFNPVNIVKNSVKRDINTLTTNPIKRTKDRIETAKAVLYGRDNYPPAARAVIEKHANDRIIKLELVRAKVPSYITSTLNALSLGKFEKNNNDGTLYHLAILLTTDKTKILLEKNEVINIEVNPKGLSTDRYNVDLKGKDITVEELLNNAAKRGGDNYFTYKAADLNCQEFCRNILYANGLNSPEAIQYTNQDTQHLFKESPKLRQFSDAVTGLAAAANVITNGAGIHKKLKGGKLNANTLQGLLEASYNSKITNENGDVTSHVQGIFNRTIKMLASGIRPVYVFDGKAPEMKGGELAKRTGTF